MPIMDYKLEFSDAQSVAAAAASTVISTNVIDLGVANAKIGEGTPIWAHVIIGSAVTSASDPGTITAALRHCATESGTYTTIAVGSAFTFSTATATDQDAVAGVELLNVPVPADCYRYLEMTYYIATSAAGGGSVDAWLDLSA